MKTSIGYRHGLGMRARKLVAAMLVWVWVGGGLDAEAGDGAVGTTEQGDARYLEVMALPDGLVVSHSPNPVRAQKLEGRRFTYTWIYATTVRAMDGPVEVEAFGAFSWVDGRWVLSNVTGKPFTREDFAEWYACPEARVDAEMGCTDASNWAGNDVLSASRSLWYYVGIDATGRRVKGTALVTALATLQQ